MKSLKTTGEIKTYPDTDSLTYDPASKLIFTFNGDSKNSAVIDPVKDAMIKTIDLGGAVEQPVADGKGTIYDNNEETNDVVVIDTTTLTVKTRWSVKPAGQPSLSRSIPSTIASLFRTKATYVGDEWTHGCSYRAR